MRQHYMLVVIACCAILFAGVALYRTYSDDLGTVKEGGLRCSCDDCHQEASFFNGNFEEQILKVSNNSQGLQSIMNSGIKCSCDGREQDMNNLSDAGSRDQNFKQTSEIELRVGDQPQVQQVLKIQPRIRFQLLNELFDGDDPFHYVDIQMQDWGYPHTNLRDDVLDDVIAAVNPSFWIEAGSMLGNSAIKTAEALERKYKTLSAMNGRIETSILCIDPFSGDVNMWAWYRGHKRDGQWSFLRNLHGRPSIYQRFLANIDAKGFSNSIIPLPATSIVGLKVIKRLHAEGRLDQLPNVIYLDSAHEIGETLLELQIAWDLLLPGGILFGDDYNWDAVRNDVQQFSASKDPRRDVLKRSEWQREGNVMIWNGQWAICKQ